MLINTHYFFMNFINCQVMNNNLTQIFQNKFLKKLIQKINFLKINFHSILNISAQVYSFRRKIEMCNI